MAACEGCTGGREAEVKGGGKLQATAQFVRGFLEQDVLYFFKRRWTLVEPSTPTLLLSFSLFLEREISEAKSGRGSAEAGLKLAAQNVPPTNLEMQSEAVTIWTHGY